MIDQREAGGPAGALYRRLARRDRATRIFRRRSRWRSARRAAAASLCRRLDPAGRAISARGAGSARFRRAAGGADRRADGSRRDQPRRRAAGPRAVRADRADRPVQPRAARDAAGRAAGRRCRRRAVAQPLQPGRQHRRHRSLLHRRARAPACVPLSVGGDHSITLSDPARRSAATRPVGLRAHRRALRHLGPAGRVEFHHGGPFRQAVLDGVLDPERTIQIGIRGVGRDAVRVLHRLRHDGDPCRGHRHAGHRRGGGEGARGGGRPAVLHFVRRRRLSTPPSRPAPARRRSAA